MPLRPAPLGLRFCARAETVIQPPVPLALRLSAQLLFGVARIYSRKTKYLLDDCSEALAKVKLVRRRPPSGQRGHRNLLAYMVGRSTCGKGRRTAKTFRAGAVDLAPDQATANYGAITIGDALFDLDAIAPILEQASGDFAGCAHTR